MTRTTSADGRWVYTLYSPAKDVPFIHALDTTGRTAACIDLPMVSNDFDGVHLRLAAGTLVVTGPRGPEAFVDTHTFAVRRHRARPAPATTPPRPTAAAGRRGC